MTYGYQPSTHTWEKPITPESPAVNILDWITEEEWETLLKLGSNTIGKQYFLNTLIAQGRIDTSQAADIWDKVEFAFAQSAEGKKLAREQEITQLKQTGEVGAGGIPQWQLEEWKDKVKAGQLTSEQVENYVQKRMGLQEQAESRERLQRAWQYGSPQPEYGEAFTETVAGLAGAEPWKDWFSSQYPSIVAKFKTTIPEFERQYWKVTEKLPDWRGLREAGVPKKKWYETRTMSPREVEKQVEKTWAGYLKAEEPKQKEEYATRYPFGQYGRPWAYQPRIQTVGF